MNGTLAGIIIASIVAPVVVKGLEKLIDRARQRADLRSVESATDRDDVRLLLTEWKELHAQRLEALEQRTANQLEDWLRRIAGCVTDDPECAQIVAEVEAEIVRLRLERL